MLVSGSVPKFHVKILMGCGFGVGGLGLYGSQGYHPWDDEKFFFHETSAASKLTKEVTCGFLQQNSTVAMITIQLTDQSRS